VVDHLLRVGETLRYAAGKDNTTAVIDGYPNFHYVTATPGRPRALLEAGINGMAVVPAGDGQRRPAILIRSSPWKAGSEQTPWHDVFDLDNGHVRYFGDSKAGVSTPPEKMKGNSTLLSAMADHRAPTAAQRARAAPLLLFRSTTKNGKVKGHVQFCGLGVIERAERLVQWSGDERTTYVNYVYDIALLDLSAENDRLDWAWISARRDPAAPIGATLELAPRSWREWVKQGNSALHRIRRRVAHAHVRKVKDQQLDAGSKDKKDLQLIYEYFEGRKHDFEAVASTVAARVLRADGHRYTDGWLTRRSGDGGADFVGRLDLGTGTTGTKLVVLGQAKCVLPTSSVSAEQIARVVARLRRGWLGVYVTTGVFSEAAQTEIFEDQYPIVLVNGKDLVRQLQEIARDDHGGNLQACLDHLVNAAETDVTNRRPEEILLQ
jgi:hypothetical protein